MGANFERWMALDMRLSARLRLDPQSRDPLTRVLWNAAVFLAHSGDSWLWMGALGLVWLLGNPEWHRKAALMAVAVGVQALTIFAIKQTIRRERPQGEWGSIYRTIDPHSFPSGHATRAALLAVLALSFGPLGFGLGVLVWAPLVMLARVGTGVHYASDVLAGALLGVLMGLAFLPLQPLVLQLVPFIF
jgi:membrane-associated phospholipid phosphatase